MTGGGRAPAVAHERAEKQDLRLDASSHFAGEGVLHSLTVPLMVGGRAFVQLSPSHLSSTVELHPLFISSLLKLFSFLGNMRSLSAKCGSWRGYRSAHQPRGNSRASYGCWAQGPLKGWNERGEYVAPFLSNRKALSSTKITVRCTSKTAENPKPIIR